MPLQHIGLVWGGLIGHIVRFFVTLFLGYKVRVLGMYRRRGG